MFQMHLSSSHIPSSLIIQSLLRTAHPPTHLFSPKLPCICLYPKGKKPGWTPAWFLEQKPRMPPLGLRLLSTNPVSEDAIHKGDLVSELKPASPLRLSSHCWWWFSPSNLQILCRNSFSHWKIKKSFTRL